MITGNKGEWSEIYTFLKLLADGRLYAADADLNRIEDVYYPIIKILRNECGGNWQYIRNANVRIVNATTQESVDIQVSEFRKIATLLLRKIKSSTGVFSVPEVEEFMNGINCSTLKASSLDKSDITIVVHDLRTGLEPTLGFSIKSKLGHSSTLLNAGQTTNFIFKINGTALTDEQIRNINCQQYMRNRFETLRSYGCRAVFHNMQNEIFKLNLQVIDSNLPLIIANVLLSYYEGQANLLTDLTDIVTATNPCNYNTQYNHTFYKYKIKRFLTDVALGMIPSRTWEGTFDANGGYIVVKEDGEVLCYHIYNINEFQEYLLRHTKLDTPSTSRYNFGTVYRENNQLFIKLNLQIRFI